MSESEWLAEQFQANQQHLRGVAYRMLGSLSEADDALQEAWLRVSRSEAGEVENLGGWLTTIVARVCLDMLRSRKSRREEPFDVHLPDVLGPAGAATDPEGEAALADSVGLALLVVLERLEPAERLAFVLHDMFAVPFEEIATIVGRSPAAARQLASRARRRVQGGAAADDVDLNAQRKVVASFLTALRVGDIDGMLAVLDPDVAVRAEGAPGQRKDIRGAHNWVKGAVTFGGRGAQFTRVVLLNGAVGLAFAPRGRLLRALTFEIENGRIAKVEVIADPARLAQLDIALLPEEGATAGA